MIKLCRPDGVSSPELVRRETALEAKVKTNLNGLHILYDPQSGLLYSRECAGYVLRSFVTQRRSVSAQA